MVQYLVNVNAVEMGEETNKYKLRLKRIKKKNRPDSLRKMNASTQKTEHYDNQLS